MVYRLAVVLRPLLLVVVIPRLLLLFLLAPPLNSMQGDAVNETEQRRLYPGYYSIVHDATHGAERADDGSRGGEGSGRVSLPPMPRETSFFGWHPVVLTQDVVNCVNDYIWDALEGLEASLEREFIVRGAAGGEDRQLGQGAEKEEEARQMRLHEALQSGLETLRTRIQYLADVNLDRFEIYVLRNVLRIPKGLRGLEQGGGGGGGAADADGVDPDEEYRRSEIGSVDPAEATYTAEDEDEVDRELAELREELRGVRGEQRRLRRERGAILRDTRSFEEMYAKLRGMALTATATHSAPGGGDDGARTRRQHEELREQFDTVTAEAVQLQRVMADCRQRLGAGYSALVAASDGGRWQLREEEQAFAEHAAGVKFESMEDVHALNDLLAGGRTGVNAGGSGDGGEHGGTPGSAGRRRNA